MEEQNNAPVKPALPGPDFVYVPAEKTDLRATFRRVRARQQRQLELPLDYPPIESPNQ